MRVRERQVTDRQGKKEKQKRKKEIKRGKTEEVRF